MLEIDPRLWWDEITGPSHLVRAIASELRDGRSVFLSVPDDLPWRKQMRSAVEQNLRENGPNLLVDYIDCQTDCPDCRESADVADLLLSRYARAEVKNGYRRSSGQSIQQYILKNQILKDRVIWVKGMSPHHVKSWMDYCRAYHTKSSSDGLFVIECHEDASRRRTATGMKLLFYKDYVGYHDALLFNHFFAAPMRRPPEWKQYLATVAAQLCGCDVELSCSLLARLADGQEHNPIQLLQEIAQTEHYEMRSHAEFLDAQHPFVMIRSGQPEGMSQGLWKAQLQVLFPLLEYERIEFISHFQEAIWAGLHEAYQDPDPKRPGPHYITQLGERVYEPYDVELGTLYRMNHLRMYRDNALYLLYLSEERDRERLGLLRDIRNSIAHMSPCSPEIVAKFLDRYPYPWQSSC